MRKMKLAFLTICIFVAAVFIPVNANWPWCIPATPFEACNECILVEMQCPGDPCGGFCNRTFWEAELICKNLGQCPQ